MSRYYFDVNNGHSGKEKVRSDLDRPESCEMSERLLKILRKSGDFQAEYEGSIPFTRFKHMRGPGTVMPSRPVRSVRIVGNKTLAEADLDVVIRSLTKAPNKSLMEAARKRHDRFMAMAASAKDKETRERYKQIAKSTLLYASAAARRLHLTAQNAADSYARAMKKAAEQPPARKVAEKPVKQAAEPKPAKKAASKKPVKKKKA